MEFLREEAEEGKVIIGNCNGAQILVESGLIPLGEGLCMSLARNAIRGDEVWVAPGFLNEWVFIRPTCSSERCATSNWEGAIMHLPIAHGEGRFVTKDSDLIAELKKNDQIAFSYCDASGIISEDASVTPNGSMEAIAGVCNPEGNVVALMPHPERTPNGDPYFVSMREWLLRRSQKSQKRKRSQRNETGESTAMSAEVGVSSPKGVEIFIDTIIVNNEERTVEQAARRTAPELRLKQLKYTAVPSHPEGVLRDIALFNHNKERAFIRQQGKFLRWNTDTKRTEELPRDVAERLFSGIALLRRDEPDTGAPAVCYIVRGVEEKTLRNPNLIEIFANTHASTLESLILFG
jgi:phosphoribosylformylglycinamidine synthase